MLRRETPLWTDKVDKLDAYNASLGAHYKPHSIVNTVGAGAMMIASLGALALSLYIISTAGIGSPPAFCVAVVFFVPTMIVVHECCKHFARTWRIMIMAQVLRRQRARDIFKVDLQDKHADELDQALARVEKALEKALQASLKEFKTSCQNNISTTKGLFGPGSLTTIPSWSSSERSLPSQSGFSCEQEREVLRGPNQHGNHEGEDRAC